MHTRPITPHIHHPYHLPYHLCRPLAALFVLAAATPAAAQVTIAVDPGVTQTVPDITSFQT